MALNKTLKGRGNADVSYHMIPAGALTKNLLKNTYSVSFSLLGFVDQDTRDNKPEVGPLLQRQYDMDITEEQMAHIIDYLGLYDYVKASDADYSDAVDVL
jgi:hypothetical protein